MFSYNINPIFENQVNIKKIPCSVFTPQIKDNKNFPLLIYYHGWSSSRKKQRFIGAIFASLGYVVILPDAINHGDRQTFKDYDKNLKDYFMQTIMQNLFEFQTLKNYAVKNLNVDKNRIAIAGHSMGGYSVAGIFTHNPEIKAAVVFNGAFDWQNAIAETENRYKAEHIELNFEEKKADPACNIEKILNRPIFILHGKKDSLVPFETQEQFFKIAQQKYSDKQKIKLVAVERMDHYISIQMLNEAIIWLSKTLKAV